MQRGPAPAVDLGSRIGDRFLGPKSGPAIQAALTGSRLSGPSQCGLSGGPSFGPSWRSSLLDRQVGTRCHLRSRFHFKATGPVCFVAWLHAMDASKSGVWEKVRRPDSSASSDDETPPSNDCTRLLCGWCLLNVTHKDGKSLKCVYRDTCMSLENSLASPPETNRELHTLNMLVQQCLHDLSSVDLQELNLVLRIPAAHIPAPPSPPTNSGWAAASAGPEPASNSGATAAASARGAQGAVDNGVVAVIAGEVDASMEEAPAEKAPKCNTANTWGKKLKGMSPAEWRA